MKILFPYMARWHAVNWSRYHSLLYALADAGHEIHVMQPPSLKSAETNFQEIETRGHPNIKVHDVALSKWIWERHLPLDKLFKKAYYSLSARSHAKRLIAEQKIDVVLLYNIPQYRFSNLSGVAVVFDYADDYVDMLVYELGRLNNPLARALARFMLASMMKRAAVTMSVSNVLAQQAEGNVHVVPNGVSLEKAAATPVVPIQAVNHGGKKVVGFLGAFEYFIDMDLMVNVAKAMPDLHFLLVGTGRGWKHVAARVADEKISNVQLTGGVPHDQVFAYIREMDVCLNIFAKLPVSHRACPIKLFEYLSQKKPVITTRLDELKYIDDGFLYYGDTVEEVSAAIRKVIADPVTAAAHAEAGYRKTADQYTWNQIGAQFAALVETAIGTASMIWVVAILVGLVLAAGLFWAGLAHREIHTWFWAYLRHRKAVAAIPPVAGVTHVMFCFVDHYEPLAAGADDKLGMQRVDRWVRDYRKVAGAFRDADGRHPSHSFFYPEEEYRHEFLDAVGDLCRDGFGEVEIHLHHDHDTPAGLTDKLSRFTTTLKERHGLLPAAIDGKIPFAFIHGNWALDNSRGDGRWCGINNELIVLREAGCYADFTLPSAPSDTQTSTINAIYYAKDDPSRPKSHDTGVEMRVGGSASGDLLIFQGPLALHWRHRKFGIWPRIENSDIAPNDIPIEDRVPLWVRQHIHVAGRPEWLFIKVHTHGAIEENADYLFGGELERLFKSLDQQCNDGTKYALHYVSAREAYNMAKAAEAGKSGNPYDYRDFVIPRAF